MRMLDERSDAKLDKVTLYLTRQEAEEMREALGDLLAEPYGNHYHLSTDDYQKEITVCIYGEDLMKPFNERSKKLILDDI